MRISNLIENDLIPPGQPSPMDDEESEQDKRWTAIHDLEQQVAQHYFKIFQKAGIELFSDEGLPVVVIFYEKTGKVEVIVETDDSFPVQALIGLSEIGAIGPQTIIRPIRNRGGNNGIDISTEFPARDTPFAQFMSDTGSVDVVSNSDSGEPPR